MYKWYIIFLILLLTIVLPFAACGPRAVPTLVPTPGAGLAVPKAPARESWETEWEKLMANARREGNLQIYATVISPMLRNSLVEVTSKKFGIKLDILGGRSTELAEKIIRERRAGLYLADGFIGGANDPVVNLKPAGVLAPMEPELFLPEVVNPEAWFGGGFRWVDQDHKIFSFLAYPSPSVGINTNLVKTEELRSYRNLLEPRWKGKITLNDPTVAGTGGKWFGMLAVGVKGKPIMGLDFMKQLVQQEIVIMRDQRQQIQLMSEGKYPIALAPVSASLAEFMQAGAPIQLITPEEGSYLTSGVGTLSFIDRAPHPNAARVFINWLLTREGQTLFSQQNDVQSARLDVPTEHLPPAKMRDPRAKYLWGDDEEFLLQQPENFKLAREVFAPLLR